MSLSSMTLIRPGPRPRCGGVDAILEQDLDVRVAALPEGEDPDSYVRGMAPRHSRNFSTMRSRSWIS